MKNILHVISSPMGDFSHSVQLGRAIIDQLLATYPGSVVVERKLAEDTIPCLTAMQVKTFFGVPLEDNANDPNWYSDIVLDELRQADIIILGAPMYNFNIHALLKAYIDQVVRPGCSFKYEPDGSRVGLLTGKTAYLSIATGGRYIDPGFNPTQKYIVDYLTMILNYIGIREIIPVVMDGTVDPAFEANYIAVAEGVQPSLI